MAFANWRNPKHLLKLTFRLPTVLWTLFQNISGFEWSGKRVAISGVSARSGPELSFLGAEVDTWGACPEFEQVRSQFGTARRWPLSFCKGQNNNTVLDIQNPDYLMSGIQMFRAFKFWTLVFLCGPLCKDFFWVFLECIFLLYSLFWGSKDRLSI